jgi:hypothetical protein
MKHLILAFLLAVTTSAGAAHADGQGVRHCEFEVKARCASGYATVTLVNGVVKRLEISAFWCGLKGRPGYTCTVDSTRGDDNDATWTDDGGATVITNATPFTATEPDRIKVTVGKYVSIDMAETQSAGRCGAGAELPQAIVIPATKGACRVWLDSNAQ